MSWRESVDCWSLMHLHSNSNVCILSNKYPVESSVLLLSTLYPLQYSSKNLKVVCECPSQFVFKTFNFLGKYNMSSIFLSYFRITISIKTDCLKCNTRQLYEGNVWMYELYSLQLYELEGYLVLSKLLHCIVHEWLSDAETTQGWMKRLFPKIKP